MGQENSTEAGDVTTDSKSQTLPLQKKKGKKQRPTSQPVTPQQSSEGGSGLTVEPPKQLDTAPTQAALQAPAMSESCRMKPSTLFGKDFESNDAPVRLSSLTCVVVFPIDEYM